MSRRDEYESRSGRGYSDRGRSDRNVHSNRNGANRSQSRRGDGRNRNRHRKSTTGINAVLLFLELLVIAGLIFILRNLVIPYSMMERVALNNIKITAAMNEGVAENKVLEGYRTIAFFGVDSREGILMGATESSQTGTLSDVIMIASINKDTGDVKLCSVYRDTFVNLQDGDYGKVNAAYSLGGPDRAIRTLNANLDLNITDFVTVGFEGVTEVVNALGGIEVDIQEEAVSHLNNYQLTMSEEMGIDYTPLDHGGLQTIDGLQATAYCRVRYIAGNDLARAGHQRDVLEAIFAKAKTASVGNLTNIVRDVLPLVKTSLSDTEILDMALDITKYNLAGTGGFPQQDKLSFGLVPNNPYAGSSVLANDLAANTLWLHAFLFNNMEYKLTPDCQANSDKIYQMTAQYMEF